MTKAQIRICKKIVRYKNLKTVLQKCGFEDFYKFQDAIDPKRLCFSDSDYDDQTIIFLSDSALEEYEAYRSRIVDVWFTRSMAILALIISTIALLGQLGILGLPKY